MLLMLKNQTKILFLKDRECSGVCPVLFKLLIGMNLFLKEKFQEVKIHQTL